MLVSTILTANVLVHIASAALTCAPKTFKNLTLPAGEILNVAASNRTNITASQPANNNVFAFNVTGLDVCEVQIQYTHPGQNDTINVIVWLPLEGWNGRYVSTGGGGFTTGRGASDMMWAAARGYATGNTDGGHSVNASVSDWALVSPGNVNWNLLQDFASIALDDFTTLGKAAVTAFYGTAPKYSYWNGCSTGGRQGHMMAQRYPTQFDGIVAGASAFNWATFVPSEYWPQALMNSLDVYPRQCELAAINRAAVAACDELDGLKDGIISDPNLCHFDPNTVIGHRFNCSETGEQMEISEGAAIIALATWTGPVTVDGKFQWYGLNKGSDLTGLANTSCSGDVCTGMPFGVAYDWIQNFVLKDPSFDLVNLTLRDFDTVMRQSLSQYDSFIGTYDTDLTDFRDAGGKMLTWHGLADYLIPPNGTYHYYNAVAEQDPNVAEYYRFFPAPGVGHCRGGNGWFPGGIFDALVNWVEKGVAPDTVEAVTSPNANGTVRRVNLCPYPQKVTYKGGDINIASSFSCES